MNYNFYQNLCQQYLSIKQKQQQQRFKLYREGKLNSLRYQRYLIELACQIRHIDLQLTELEEEWKMEYRVDSLNRARLNHEWSV